MTFIYLLLSNAQAANDGSGLWMPRQASELAEDIDNVFFFIYWVSVVFFIILMGGMIYLAWVYRRRSEDEMPPVIKGSHTLEFVWSVFPSFLLIAMFVMGFKIYMKSTVPPADAIDVKVVGQQWNWQYYYPKYNIKLGASEALVVPVDQSVRLQMYSMDVLHSFWVPDFRMKKDVLPNRYTVQWFQANDVYEDGYAYMQGENTTSAGTAELVSGDATETVQFIVDYTFQQCKNKAENDPSLDCTKASPIKGKVWDGATPISKDSIKAGVHQVFCTEYCGDDHSRMLSKVVVLEQKYFDVWIDGKKNYSPYTDPKMAQLDADKKPKVDENGDLVYDPVKVGEYLSKKTYACTGCHAVQEGKEKAGYPTWWGLAGSNRNFEDGTSTVANDEYIKSSIILPQSQIVSGYGQNKMPSSYANMDEKDIASITAYIKTLK